MPEYTYVAQDADGKEKKGNVVADTPQNAVELVSAEGLIVLSVKVSKSTLLLLALNNRTSFV